MAAEPAPVIDDGGDTRDAPLATVSDVSFGTGTVRTVALGPFPLESAAVLPDLVVAYRHDGPGPADAPQVLVVHALTGSADAAGDWWEPLIGPGRAFDTDRFGVLCANLLGGRYGTTGPTSNDPGTGEPYGSSFPQVTARDQARAQWTLLDRLGIADLELVTGGSLGGMVALEVALERPGAVRTVMPIAAPAAIGALAMAWNRIQVAMIEGLGVEGMNLARQLAMTTYRSEVDFDSRFSGRTEADGRPSVVSYLDHQGRKLVDRFDPGTYVTLVGAMDSHDIGRGRGGVEAALATLNHGDTIVVGLGIQGDILFGPAQVQAVLAAARAAGLPTRYEELRSTKGHDAFLVEWDQLTEIFRRALPPHPAGGPRRTEE
jgi:homoserine O-acetyltransferase/O-succinyltransferase